MPSWVRYGPASWASPSGPLRSGPAGGEGFLYCMPSWVRYGPASWASRRVCYSPAGGRGSRIACPAGSATVWPAGLPRR
eukprot:1995967-Pyramimonas_sp.AAC.1